MNNTFFFRITRHDLKSFEICKVFMHRPNLLAFYTYDQEDVTKAEYIKYFKMPKPQDYPLNLNSTFFVDDIQWQLSPGQSRLLLPLSYMMSTEGSNCSNAVKNKHSTVKVYTGRRALTQIMEWPYENKYDFNLWISRYNNELYMTGVLSYLNNTCSHHDRLQQLLFSDSPDEIPNIDDIPNRTMGQSVLHQSKIGKYTLLYAGEAQGIISDKKIENFDDIDALDKCRFVFTKQLWKNLNPWVKQRKLLKFWIQSYLSNVDDLYVAYKNDDGNVTLPIEYIKVSTIPQGCFLFALDTTFVWAIQNIVALVFYPEHLTSASRADLARLRFDKVTLHRFTIAIYCDYFIEKHEIQSDTVSEIIAAEQFWKPSVSFGFLHYFLEQVEQAMSNVNCLDTVYEFTFKARDKTTSYKIYEGKSEKSFIPKKYSDFVNKENQI